RDRPRTRTRRSRRDRGRGAWVTARAGQARRMGRVGLVGLILAAVTAQAPNPNAPANFITIQSPVIALTHVRVIDGTGAAARADQTIVIRDGNISELGNAA